MLNKRWVELEKPFAANNYDGNKSGKFFEFENNSPILLLARHAVNHQYTYNDKEKVVDLRTGSMVRLLSEETTVSNICRIRRGRNEPKIDQWEHIKPLIKKIKPRIIFDIHGAKITAPFDIGIITGSGITLSQSIIIDILKIEAACFGFKVEVNPAGYIITKPDHPFSRIIDEVPSTVLLEFNYRLRSPTKYPKDANNAICMMKRVLAGC